VFVRIKKNRTGTCSVHIVQKINGRQVHIQTVGFSDDPLQIKNLKIKAYEQMAHLQKRDFLPLVYREDVHHIEQLKSSIVSIQATVCLTILERLFEQIGFNQINDTLFRHLVIMRVLYPVSKLKTTQYLKRHFGINYKADDIYRYMDKLQKNHHEHLQKISVEHTEKLLNEDLSVVFYDVTTLYFETEREDELRKMGFSKDGKAQNPQIVLGLLVSAQGYPLAYEMFEGNTFEGKTMLPVLQSFKHRYGLQRLIIIADAGLLSNANIQQLLDGGYEFVLAARIKNETQVIKNKILELHLGDGQSAVIEKSAGLKLIVSYASARAAKDEHNRMRGLQKLERQLSSGKLNKQHLNNRGYNKYLKLEGEVHISIDYDKYSRDAVWDGLKAYLHNTTMSNERVIEQYKNLWHIEKAFRISKTDLKVRPVYHRLKRRIQSHLNIAFCSYKLFKELERQLKTKKLSITPEKAIEILKSIYSVNTILPASKKETAIIIVKTKEQQDLLDAFNIVY
jgi:transposase